jgi:hypothetical protein
MAAVMTPRGASMPVCRWLALLCLLCFAAPAVASDAAEESFPGYQPKLSPDTVLDYRPELRTQIETLPEPSAENLRALLDALDHYRDAAGAQPGRWIDGSVPLGGDPREYEPSDAELLLAEVGDRIGLVAATMHPAAFAAAMGMLGREVPISYPRFAFRHVDVMGSGRFFYASDAAPTEVPSGASAPESALDFAAVKALPPEQRAAYLAGVADALRSATQLPPDRLQLLANCVRGFSGEQLRDIFDRFWPAERHLLADQQPAPVALVLAMVDACQLQWTVPADE